MIERTGHTLNELNFFKKYYLNDNSILNDKNTVNNYLNENGNRRLDTFNTPDGEDTPFVNNLSRTTVQSKILEKLIVLKVR